VTSEREYRRRATPLAQRFKRSIHLAQVASVVVATVSTTTVMLLTRDLPGPVRLVIAVALSTALGIGAFLLALTPRTRRALEAFSWVGERDMDRFIRETGSRPPTSTRGARRWLADHRETAKNAGHRTDVHLVVGEIEEARRSAELMPTSTPWEVFQREVQLDYIDRVAGLAEARPGLAQAAARLELPEEQRHAEVQLAWAESSRLALAGGDWRAPLVESRARLGDVANGMLLRSRVVRAHATILVIVTILGALLQLPA
jgi:hypothetical protein